MLWLFLASALAQSNCVETSEYRAGRPDLSGETFTVDSDDGRFRVHYTLEGDDKPGGDMDEHGVPEMVARTLDGVQIGAEAFAKRGYLSFEQDDGTGGSDALDIYLKQVSANGFANAAPGPGEASSCYFRLDPDLGSLGGQMVESVAAHELHHCVQFAYTTDSHSFMYESGATYEQYLALMDEGLELAVNVLYVERLSEPERRLSDHDGRFPYAGFLFMKFWSEYGTPDEGRVPALWQRLSQEPQWEDALRSESRRIWDAHFDEVFLDFARYNAFACSRDDGQHYDAESLACSANIEVPYEAVTSATGSVAVELEEPRYTAAYARWEDATEGMLTQLTCSAPVDPNGEMRVILAHLDAAGALAEHQSLLVEEQGSTMTLSNPNGAGGESLAVFASTGEGPVSADCFLSEVEPEPEGCGCSASTTAGLGLWMLPALMGWSRRRR